MIEKQLLTANEAADFLRCSPKTLANWRSKGIGPAFVKSGRIAYELRVLEKWIDDLSAKSTAQARMNRH